MTRDDATLGRRAIARRHVVLPTRQGDAFVVCAGRTEGGSARRMVAWLVIGIALAALPASATGSRRAAPPAVAPDPATRPDSQAGEDRVVNGGFEDGLANWNAGSYHVDPAFDDGTEEIVSEGCLSGRCLKMTHGSSTWQGASQSIGELAPGATYVLRAHFRTATTHYGHTNVYDASWRDATCEVKARSTTRRKPGMNGWTELVQVVRVPEEDECGPLEGHRWSVYLYSYAPTTDPSPVYYDEVSFAPVTGWDTTNLEDDADLGIVTCEGYQDGYPLVPCHDDVLVRRVDPVAGSTQVALTGTRGKQEWLTFDIPVRPRALYRVRVSLAIEDRVVFNYLDLAYPANLTRQQPGIRDAVDLTKGIWSGVYDVTVDGASILPPIIKDAEYRSPSHLDRFTETATFETVPGQAVAHVAVRLSGFEGKLVVDDLSVTEASSFIDDAFFHMSVPEGYQGMRIARVDESPPAVETNAARYVFTQDEIACARSGDVLAALRFEPALLGDLQVRREPGNVVLENDSVLVSVGADSVVLMKLKTAATVTVTGPRRAYHVLEAGVIFVADGTQGVLFAPLRPPASVRNMPYHVDSRGLVADYADADFARLGQLRWTTVHGFDEPEWRVDYEIAAGAGFVAQVFPPKVFDEDAYCTERMHTMGTDTVETPDADFRYHLQRVGAQIETGLVWMSDYAAAENELEPPEEYCLNAAREPVHCDSSAVATRQPVGIRFDVTGPYAVAYPAAFRRLVDQAHARGMRLIVYMSPEFYYTTDVAAFLGDLRRMVEEFDVDGVYYDGLYSGRPLESLALARRTRLLLGDGYYAQHSSWVNTLVRRTHRYRVPFLDAQADVLWLGEGVKAVDDATWQYNFCGRGVSNTASLLLAELRPVDWTADKATSVGLTLSPQEQVSRTLACGGLFRTTPYGEVSTIHDTHFQTSIPFESALFLEPYNARCVARTCGNGRCDVGESLRDCLADCAPVDPSVVQTRRGDEHRCPADGPVAQWLLDGEPLHLLHYTFDEEIAGDVSGHEHHPDHSFGVARRPPVRAEIDGRLAYAFDGATYLYGGAKAVLDRTDKPFSAFAVVRLDAGAADGRHTILSFHPGPNLALGVIDGRFTADVLDGDKAYGTEEIVEEGCYRGRCALARHNDATWQGISQTLGPLRAGETYTFGAMFRTTTTHDGYINLYDRDWQDASCRRTGRSFDARWRGNASWQAIEVAVRVPERDDCGEPTADDAWSALLYTYSPLDDNSPIAYDETRLTATSEPATNLLANPGFEDGFAGWNHSSYIARDSFAGQQTTMADGAWHAVGITYDPPRLTLYVDGGREATGTIRVAPFGRLGNWAIGSAATASASESFVGHIDDLVVSARALSSEQAAQYAADQLRTLTHDGEASCLFVADGATLRTARRDVAWLPRVAR